MNAGPPPDMRQDSPLIRENDTVFVAVVLTTRRDVSLRGED